MTLFNNICRQHDDAIEKQLVTRQLSIKTTESKSWFTILKKTLIKYNFSNINELVEKPPKKSMWKSLIMKAVECYILGQEDPRNSNMVSVIGASKQLTRLQSKR